VTNYELEHICVAIPTINERSWATSFSWDVVDMFPSYLSKARVPAPPKENRDTVLIFSVKGGY